jgi:hypothetical protein
MKKMLNYSCRYNFDFQNNTLGKGEKTGSSTGSSTGPVPVPVPGPSDRYGILPP